MYNSTVPSGDVSEIPGIEISASDVENVILTDDPAGARAIGTIAEDSAD